MVSAIIFFHKLVEHGRGQLIKVGVFLCQGQEFIGAVRVLVKLAEVRLICGNDLLQFCPAPFYIRQTATQTVFPPSGLSRKFHTAF